MRLLVVSPDLRLMGGVAETVKLLLRELEGRAEVTSAVLGRRLNQNGIARLLRVFADLFSFFKLLWSRRFDVIHMNPSLNFISFMKEGMLLLLFYLFGYSGRVLIFIHGWDEHFFARIAVNRFYSTLMSVVLNRAGLVLVLAEDFRCRLDSIGVDICNVKVISTMVDLDKIPISRSCESNEKSLLFLSRMIPGKGVYELLDAFSLLCDKYDSLRLIMAGDGPEKQRLMEIAASRGLSNVVFPGYIQGDEKRRTFEESCIYLLPTSREGCPVSLLEAMASGLVPVVTDAGGIKDVIKPGETVILLEEISAKAIAGAVEGLLADPIKLQKVAKAARSYAAANFGSRQITDRIIGFYEHLDVTLKKGKVI
ncbi:MAG TPA: hypothetical protein DCS48_13580 [Desulfovibrio sp.]|nr:hypothetical protein [Desulfovibrio sp.]